MRHAAKHKDHVAELVVAHRLLKTLKIILLRSRQPTVVTLAIFLLFSNSLSGQIPEVIYKNLNLMFIDVSNNNLYGDITTGMTSFHYAL
jgi:hypothetical protein